MATTGDLNFRISADFKDVKTAIQGLRNDIAQVGAGADAAGIKAVTEGLADTADAAKKAGAESVKQSREQVKAQQLAAREAAAAARQAAQEKIRADREAATEAIRQKREEDRQKSQSERDRIKQEQADRKAAERAAAKEAAAKQKAQRSEADKLTRAAPQVTDIATSLAGGQNPFLVLLQQGGQLRDIFGGVGPAIRAVGAAVASIITPFTLAAGAVGALTLAYIKGADEGARFRRTLIETGNQSGQTASQLGSLARSLSTLPGITQGSASAALNQVVATAQFTGTQILTVAKAAEQLRANAGRDVGETVAEFVELAKGPVEAVDKLNQKYNFLNGAVLEQIRTLQLQGRTQEAATLAINAYASAIDTRAPKIKENLGIIERGWTAVKRATSGAVDAVLNIGRDDLPEEQLQSLVEQQARLQSRLDNPRGLQDRSAAGRERLQARLEQVRQQAAQIQEAEAKAQAEAQKDAARGRAVQIQNDLADEAAQYKSAAQRREEQRTQIANRVSKAVANATIAGDTEAAAQIKRATDQIQAGLGREAARSNAGVVEANASLVKDATDRGLLELDRLYEQGKVKLSEFLRTKAQLQTEAVDAELRAAKAERAGALEPEEVARANAKILQLTRQRANIQKDIAFEAKQLAQRNADEIADIKAQQLEREGKLEDAARLRFEKEYRVLRERLTAENDQVGLGLLDALLQGRQQDIRQQTADQVLEIKAQQLEAERRLEEAAILRTEVQYRELRKRLANDPAGLAVVDKIIDTQRTRAKFDEVKAQFDESIGAINQNQQLIQAQIESGSLNAVTGERLIREERAKSIEQLRQYILKLAELYQKTADPAILEQIKAASIEIENTKNAQDQLQNTINANAQSALQGFFTDLATNARTLGDAIKNLAVTFIQSLARMAAEALAKRALLALAGGGDGGLGGLLSSLVAHSGAVVGGAGGTRRSVSPLVFAGAPRYHSGGLVGLAPDERPAILQTGEEVLSRGDPRNRANGGGQSGGSGTRIINVIDPNLVGDFMASAGGERTILNVIERNAGAIRQKLT